MAKTKDSGSKLASDPFVYILTYVLSILTGIIMYIVAVDGDSKRLKLHAMQAIVLGIVWIVLSFVLFFIPYLGTVLGFVIWLYGMYIGFRAYEGVDVEIPYITAYLKRA